jgi:heptosyltransferase I
MEQSIHRIAVVRLSAIGDVCHAMAVVNAVQTQYPNAEITWITGPAESQIVKLMPNINVVVYNKKSGFKGMLALRKQLKHEKFDVLLHMQWSLRASLLTRMLKAKRRIGFARSISRDKQHLFVNELAPEPNGFHVLNALMSVARGIGVPEQAPSWNIQVKPHAFDLPNDYVIVNPCGSKPSKNWTLNGYRKLLSMLLEKGEKVVLTGGPSEDEKAFCGQIAQGFDVISLVGKTSLEELLSVIGEAKLVVSPDTGPAHMATVMDTPVVTLFALSNPNRTGPYNDLDKVVSVYVPLVEKEQGKPLADIPWATTVHAKDAMAQLPEEEVLEMVARHL